MPSSTDLSAEFATAQQLVRLLQQQPQAFPHPVERVECIETHISWVLLAGDFAYKLKNPCSWTFWTSVPMPCGTPPARKSCASIAARRRACTWAL